MDYLSTFLIYLFFTSILVINLLSFIIWVSETDGICLLNNNSYFEFYLVKRKRYTLFARILYLILAFPSFLFACIIWVLGVFIIKIIKLTILKKEVK